MSDTLMSSSTSTSAQVLVLQAATATTNQTKNKKPLPEPALCQGCGISYPSRNAVFRHLRDTQGACLSPTDYENFVQYVSSQDRIKTVVLYGYIPSNECLKRHPTNHGDHDDDPQPKIRNGDDAVILLKEAMNCPDEKINRSYGTHARGNDILAQDEGTGAITEVVCVRLPPMKESFLEWKQSVQTALTDRFFQGKDSSLQIRVLGRLDMPHKKFNAEMDVTHRRMEYLIPADFLYIPSSSTDSTTRNGFFQQFPTFSGDNNPFATEDRATRHKLEPNAKQYLYNLKKRMQLLTTQIVTFDPLDPSAVLEKQFHTQKRKRQRKKQQTDHEDQVDTHKTDPKPSSSPTVVASETTTTTKRLTKCNVLRRRRFHNFTPRVMAHEFLAYRRLDRFFHRATLRFPACGERPFLALSLTGDMFLQGQTCRVIGLFLAIVRGLVEEDIVDCVFDEQYPPLVPTPPVPSFAMYAAEATYVSWEGKAKAILSPRVCNRYKDGWNSRETLEAVADWQTVVHSRIAEAWMQEGVDDDGRLVAEKRWTEDVLEPWATRAREQLKDYRLWKSAQNQTDMSPEATLAVLPSVESVDATVPALFEKVLHYLRKADASGLWPTTTPKRQMVMMSTLTSSPTDDPNVAPTPLSVAHMKAKSNKDIRSSAYDFVQGEGGASGSFSVGAMPGEQCIQPKGNSLFPELMKAAFELEMALCPNREPSSTIAINRNAQFRPHTDSGAGAGQSTSLIVGLGTYVGGELVVEGEWNDIRYKAIEFNGWTQRHWTMPFRGERFSLVWFTPKGCEGIRGIDLCADIMDHDEPPT